MTLFTELRQTAAELLDEFGEDVVIRRPAGTLDPATLRVDTTATLTQTLRGTLSSAGDRRLPDSFTRTFERLAYCSAAATSGTEFEPQVGDVVEAEDQAWAIARDGILIEKRQGVRILYTLALVRA